jgi:hypothetical protein
MRVVVTGTRDLSDRLAQWSRTLRGPASDPERVQRRELPYWQERGWTRNGNSYTGQYQTAYGSYRGEVEDRGSNNFRFYLFDPPDALRASSHWACFQPRGFGRYLVHMARRPADISSGILTIERLLAECLEPEPSRSLFDDLTRAWRELTASER